MRHHYVGKAINDTVNSHGCAFSVPNQRGPLKSLFAVGAHLTLVVQQKFQTLAHSLVEILCLTNSENRVTFRPFLAGDCHVLHCQCDQIDWGSF